MLNNFKFIIKKIIRVLYSKKILLVYDHNRFQNQSSSARIVKANDSNIYDTRSFQNEEYIKVFLGFLKKGDTGYLAYEKGECVHRSWVRSGVQSVNLNWAFKLQIEKNEHYIHYCETAVKARGKNIYPHILIHIAQDYKNKGRVFLTVNKKNMPSIKGVEKAGFIEKERIMLLVIFGFKIKRVRRSTGYNNTKK